MIRRSRRNSTLVLIRWAGLLGVMSGLLCPCTSRAAGESLSLSAEDAAEAKRLREKGADFFMKKDFPRAVEFLQKSLAIERKFGAMAQLASALNELKRFDEALLHYETALAEFPQAPAARRKQATNERDTLLSKVGTISVEGDVIKGSRLFIDSRDVGELPLQAPIRVLGGVHEVRAEKTGFAPIVVSVNVTAGQAIVAKLAAKERQAKLDIREKHGWVLRVEIDGQDAGVSPLPLIVNAGEHRIRLHGYMHPDALLLCETPGTPVDMGARMESEEKTINVGLFETQMVEVSAEDMDASLHIDSTPPLATLWIDGHEVGKSPWEGRLPLGEHAIEVRAKGFYTAKQTVTLERRKQRDLALTLEREPDRAADARTARNAKLLLGLAYGVGGIGLGMFGVAGGLALRDRNILQANCVNGRCPSTEDGRVQEMNTLGTISTIGVVIAGGGAAAGTTLFFLNRPEEHKGPKGPTIHMGLGLGRLAVEGRF